MKVLCIYVRFLKYFSFFQLFLLIPLLSSLNHFFCGYLTHAHTHTIYIYKNRLPTTYEYLTKFAHPTFSF